MSWPEAVVICVAIVCGMPVAIVFLCVVTGTDLIWPRK